MRVSGNVGWLAFLALLTVAALTRPALAERRVALVIGNGAYANVPALGNPPNDAKAIADRLRGLNFEVTEGIDLTKAAMDQTIRTFGETVIGSDIAMVFYAGHGVQVNGHNYLVPIDAHMPHREQDLHYDFVDVDTIMDEVASARQLRIVVLDACRDNPIATELGRSLGRSLGSRGLAAPPDMDNTLVSYATAANATALDGQGGHSPFTSALLKYLPEPNLEVRMLFGRVRDSVRRETGNQQNPFVYESLGGEGFYLNPTKTAAAGDPEPKPPAAGQPPSPPAVETPRTTGTDTAKPMQQLATAMPPPLPPPVPRAPEVVNAMTGRWRFSDGRTCSKRFGTISVEDGMIHFEWHLGNGAVNVAVERIDRMEGNAVFTTVLSDVGTPTPETGQRVRYQVSPDGWSSENLITHDRASHQRC